jgi:holo-[acyl-carrier protein] synthase
MAAGVGIELMGIARMQRALERTPGLTRRLFSDEERRDCEHTPWPAEHYAARYAARKAVLKALGLRLSLSPNGSAPTDEASDAAHGQPAKLLEDVQAADGAMAAEEVLPDPTPADGSLSDEAPASAGWQDVSVHIDEQGRPQALLVGVPARVAEARDVREIALSLSFTHEVATAMALLITDDVRPHPKEEKPDQQQALLASFRDARGLIDELEALETQQG